MLDDDDQSEKELERQSIGQKFWTEERFNCINKVGLIVNILVCLCLGTLYGAARVQSYRNVQVEPWLITCLIVAAAIQTFLLLLSAVFLGVALKGLSKEFTDGQRLEINRGMMCLLTFLVFSFAACIALYELSLLLHFVAVENHTVGEMEQWGSLFAYLVGASN